MRFSACGGSQSTKNRTLVAIPSDHPSESLEGMIGFRLKHAVNSSKSVPKPGSVDSGVKFQPPSNSPFTNEESIDRYPWNRKRGRIKPCICIPPRFLSLPGQGHLAFSPSCKAAPVFDFLARYPNVTRDRIHHCCRVVPLSTSYFKELKRARISRVSRLGL